MDTSKIAFGRLGSALLAYRVMAFITGTVLLIGTIGLILQQIPSIGITKSMLGPVWVGHGYLFVVYVLVTINLGLKLRWNPVRMFLTALAGTVPTMSFVAERVVMRSVTEA